MFVIPSCPGRGAALSRRCEASSVGAAPQSRDPSDGSYGPRLCGAPRRDAAQCTASGARDIGATRARGQIEGIQQINPTGKSLRFIGSCVKPLAKKYFCFTESQIRLYQHPSRPTQRGIAQGHQCGTGMRWTLRALLTRAPGADGEIVWFRHPKGCVSSSRSGARATVAKVQGSPRRSPISRKPSRGECRVIPV